MSELFFEDAHRFCREFQGASGRIKNDELREVAGAFDRNLSRVAALVELPLHVFEVAARTQLRWCIACFNVLGTPQLVDHSDPRLPAVEAELDRLEEIPTTFEKQRRPLATGEAALAHYVEEDVTVLDRLTGALASQVISAWSAFETLAADLWEHSLNARPAVIGKAVASRSGAKTVEFSVFGTHGFNLESVAGTVLKKKYDFQRLEGIQEAYEHAFGKILFKPQADRLERMLSQKGVRSAAAVRNVLVHRGGVVDNKFKQQTQHQETDNIVVDGATLTSGDYLLENAVEGQPVPLNGRTTAGLTNILVNCGLDLLAMADTVLTANPK